MTLFFIRFRVRVLEMTKRSYQKSIFAFSSCDEEACILWSVLYSEWLLTFRNIGEDQEEQYGENAQMLSPRERSSFI